MQQVVHRQWLRDSVLLTKKIKKDRTIKLIVVSLIAFLVIYSFAFVAIESMRAPSTPPSMPIIQRRKDNNTKAMAKDDILQVPLQRDAVVSETKKTVTPPYKSLFAAAAITAGTVLVAERWKKQRLSVPPPAARQKQTVPQEIRDEFLSLLMDEENERQSLINEEEYLEAECARVEAERRMLFEAVSVLYDQNMAVLTNLHLRQESTQQMHAIMGNALARRLYLQTDVNEKTLMLTSTQKELDALRFVDRQIYSKILLRPIVLHEAMRRHRVEPGLDTTITKAICGAGFWATAASIAPYELFLGPAGLPVTLFGRYCFALPFSADIVTAAFQFGGYALSQAPSPEWLQWKLLSRFHAHLDELKRLLAFEGGRGNTYEQLRALHSALGAVKDEDRCTIIAQWAINNGISDLYNKVVEEEESLFVDDTQ